jgi:hypothetical protein
MRAQHIGLLFRNGIVLADAIGVVTTPDDHTGNLVARLQANSLNFFEITFLQNYNLRGLSPLRGNECPRHNRVSMVDPCPPG